MSSNKYNTLICTIVSEFRFVASNISVVLVIVGGMIVYSILYNYIYAPQLLTDVDVAVVDMADDDGSRRFIRLLDATPAIRVKVITADAAEAERLMRRGDVKGFMILGDASRGDASACFAAGNSAADVQASASPPFCISTESLLYYSTLSKAAAAVGLSMSNLSSEAPFRLKGVALYNPSGGYATYLMPPVIMVILFQIIMMSVCISAGGQRVMMKHLEAAGSCSGIASAVQIVPGRGFVYFCIFAVFAAFLIFFLPSVFSLPALGSRLNVAVLMVPFLLASIFMAIAVSAFATDEESPLLLISFFSVGLLFLSGVSYPLQLMPWIWRAAHYLIPVATVVPAYVRVRSMGVELWQVSSELAVLWAQTIAFFVIAVIINRPGIKNKCY